MNKLDTTTNYDNYSTTAYFVYSLLPQQQQQTVLPDNNIIGQIVGGVVGAIAFTAVIAITAVIIAITAIRRPSVLKI